MSVNKNHQAAKAVALVHKIKEVTNKLATAITKDDNLNKCCFDGAITKRAKCVDAARKKYIAAAEECDNLQDQLESAKARLNDLNLDYKDIQEENKSLQRIVESIKCGGPMDLEGANVSRLKLKLYKNMTGVYFDLNSRDNNLSGYVAIKKDGQHHSGLVPFNFCENEPDISKQLWGKIREALTCVMSDIPDSFVLHTAKAS